MLQRFPLPYHIATTDYFERIRPLGNAILLDSGKPDSERGRFDILCAAPLCTLRYQHGALSGDQLPAEVALSSTTPPFQALKQLHQHFALPSLASDDLPFIGGWVGLFGYDLGRALETLPAHACNDMSLPDMQVGLYPWAVVIDHQQQRAELVCSALTDTDTAQQVLKRLNTPATTTQNPSFKLLAPFSSNTDEASYHEALRKIDDYIHAGDCYQVNFAQRFSSQYEGDLWQAYCHLRKAAPTHYAAYVDTDTGAVLSLSPERFLSVDAQGHVITQPIKGTRPRGKNTSEDKALAEALQHSEKDRAENVMIVDLLRNDLSKVCQPHSVKVPSLFAIESYRNVHHLVSTVTGTLDTGTNAIDLLEQCFPGGSITGAPKIRAMEIIDELEAHRRNIYCGSIGYISLCGKMDTSITIRTLLAENGKLHCWAGGGIVADSVSAQEYQETYDKVNNLLHTLETL